MLASITYIYTSINITPLWPIKFKIPYRRSCNVTPVVNYRKTRKYCFVTRGQFWPSGIVVVCVCLCVCVRLCVNHELLRAITHHLFKLGSPKLDHRCKIPWLISLLFFGVNDLDLQGQIKLQRQNLLNFELVRVITHHLFKLGSPNFGQRCKIPWSDPYFWGFWLGLIGQI